MENNPALKPKVLAGRKQAGAGKVRRSFPQGKQDEGKEQKFKMLPYGFVNRGKEGCCRHLTCPFIQKMQKCAQNGSKYKAPNFKFYFFPNIFPPLTERHKDGFLPFFLYKKYIQIMLKIFLCRKVTIKSPIWV